VTRAADTPGDWWHPYALGALAVTAIAIALCWAGAHAAALAAGHPGADITLAAATHALARLPRHLDDPAAAWPAAIASRLPHAAPYYWAAQLAVIVATITAARAGERVWRRHRDAAHPLGVRPHAGLARTADLARLAVARPAAGRVTLGHLGRRLIAAEPQASLAVVGPTGCGKTAGFAIPALLEWDGPVVATSVKADLLAVTVDHRRQQAPVWVYDPTGATGTVDAAGAHNLAYTPLTGCETWSEALRMAATLCQAAQPARDTVTDGDYWYTQARKGLAPYLHAAALARRSLRDVIRWIDAQDVDEVDTILADDCRPADEPDDTPDADRGALDAEFMFGPPPPWASDALVAFRALATKEAKLRDSIYATIENVLAAWADPAIAAPAGEPLDVDAWLADGHTIYLIAATHDQARLRPVFTTITQHLVRAAFDTANRNGGTLARPCLALLDEAANIAPLADLPAYAATARSHGVTLVTIWQDLAQLDAIYGHRARTVLNNHRAKLFGAGIADAATLDYLARLVGDQATAEHNHTADVTGGRRSISTHHALRPVAPADTARRLRPGDALLLYGSELPARLRLRPWYETRDLDEIVSRSRPPTRLEVACSPSTPPPDPPS
jgi:type IV secretion system protein VirD4